MLSFEEWLNIIRGWVHQGQWEKVKLSARKRRQAKEQEKAGRCRV
jgi:hypothetical protein